MNKRQALTRVVGGLIFIGIFIASIPFVKMMGPSDKATNKHRMHIDISKIEPGTYIFVGWERTPVIIYRPNEDAVKLLKSYNNKAVWGPEITKENIKQLYVYKKTSTYLGCSLLDAKVKNITEWPDGWYDPCHTGFWDYTGRSLNGVNTPGDFNLKNLTQIKYRKINESMIELRK